MKEIAKENLLLVALQTVSLALLWWMFGPGPGFSVGVVAGAFVHGYLKHRTVAGSMQSYFDNWRQALVGTGFMVATAFVVGVPVLAIAIALTPTAADDWREALADYGLSGSEMGYRIVVVVVLGIGLLAFAHLLLTRLGFKMVAVLNRR